MGRTRRELGMRRIDPVGYRLMIDLQEPPDAPNSSPLPNKTLGTQSHPFGSGG